MEQAGVEENDYSEVHLEEVVASVVVEGMEEEVHGPWVEAYRTAVGPGSHSAWVEEERWVVRDAAEADVANEIPFQGGVGVEVLVLVPSSVEALFPSLEAEAPVPSLEVPGQAWALDPCYSLSPFYYFLSLPSEDHVPFLCPWAVASVDLFLAYSYSCSCSYSYACVEEDLLALPCWDAAALFLAFEPVLFHLCLEHFLLVEVVVHLVEDSVVLHGLETGDHVVVGGLHLEALLGQEGLAGRLEIVSS